jgi:hypothetical protein
MPRTRSTTVVGSPSAAGETIIAQITGLQVPAGGAVDIEATVDMIIGTAGVSVAFRVRQGLLVSGTQVVQYGAFTAVAGNRYNFTVNAVDIQPNEEANMAYTLTVIVNSATGVSNVQNIYMGALY